MGDVELLLRRWLRHTATLEIPVEAPSAGRISEIRVAEGDAIEEGDVVVVLD